MTEPLFLSLDSTRLAHEIAGAERYVCYAAPGILPEPAAALAGLVKKINPRFITVDLDFNEHVMRMGFGTFEAAQTVRNAGIKVCSISGFRTGLVVIDDVGYVFTPIALYLESDKRPDGAPNAMRLSKDQAAEALSRLSSATQDIAATFAKNDKERERILDKSVEAKSEEVKDFEFKSVERGLREAPPVEFDIARQVNVFISYLQYVEIKLAGAAIQRHTLTIPSSIQKLGGAGNLEGRLKSTFDLIERNSELSSENLENRLNEIRYQFAPYLGKEHGRVILKRDKEVFKEKIEEFRSKLLIHQIKRG